MDINILLDKAKEQCGVQMEKDLAKRLGVSPQAVSNYRKGRALPDPVVSATLAGLTGVPLARVLGIVGEARAISREEKAVWRKLAATAMLLLFAVGIGSAPTAATASPGIDKTGMYIMLNRASARLGYYWRLLKLGLASFLPAIGPKDRTSIDACQST